MATSRGNVHVRRSRSHGAWREQLGPAAAQARGHGGRGLRSDPRRRPRGLRGPRKRVAPATTRDHRLCPARSPRGRCDSSSLTTTPGLLFLVKNGVWMTGETSQNGPESRPRPAAGRRMAASAAGSPESSRRPFLCAVPISTAPRQGRAGGVQAGGGETPADALLLWSKPPRQGGFQGPPETSAEQYNPFKTSI